MKLIWLPEYIRDINTNLVSMIEVYVRAVNDFNKLFHTQDNLGSESIGYVKHSDFVEVATWFNRCAGYAVTAHQAVRAMAWWVYYYYGKLDPYKWWMYYVLYEHTGVYDRLRDMLGEYHGTMKDAIDYLLDLMDKRRYLEVRYGYEAGVSFQRASQLGEVDGQKDAKDGLKHMYYQIAQANFVVNQLYTFVATIGQYFPDAVYKAWMRYALGLTTV